RIALPLAGSSEQRRPDRAEEPLKQRATARPHNAPLKRATSPRLTPKDQPLVRPPRRIGYDELRLQLRCAPSTRRDAPDRRALTTMGKAQCRMLERPPLTLIAAPGAPAKAVDWMVARGARQVVPAVRGFTPGYAATRLATFDPSGARTICTHGSLLHLSHSSRLRLRRASVKGYPEELLVLEQGIDDVRRRVP